MSPASSLKSVSFRKRIPVRAALILMLGAATAGRGEEKPAAPADPTPAAEAPASEAPAPAPEPTTEDRLRDALRKLAEQAELKRRLGGDPAEWVREAMDAQLLLLGELRTRLENIEAEREKQRTETIARLDELTKRIDELGAKIDAEKAARDKENGEIKASVTAEADARKRELREQQREIDRLKEKTMADFDSALFDGIEFVLIPAGSFRMGISDASVETLSAIGRWNSVNDCERPVHDVRITRPFLIAKFETTQAQWKRVMGEKDNPSAFKGDDRPVEQVNWHDANKFLKRLSEQTGHTYRLPSEAEWEYCARGEAEGLFARAADGTELTFDNVAEYAWLSAESDNKTQPVGKKKPTAGGLHDIHGNVWEWCRDWFDPDYYAVSRAEDPVCGEKGTERVFRGGAWVLDSPDVRLSIRGGNLPDHKSPYVGFRIVRELEAR